MVRHGRSARGSWRMPATDWRQTRSVRRSWGHGAVRIGGKLLRERRYRRYLFDARSRNRVFLASILRIWAAYRLGSMRYLLFTARRPGGEGLAADQRG